jgi:hypothetical protein
MKYSNSGQAKSLIRGSPMILTLFLILGIMLFKSNIVKADVISDFQAIRDSGKQYYECRYKIFGGKIQYTIWVLDEHKNYSISSGGSGSTALLKIDGADVPYQLGSKLSYCINGTSIVDEYRQDNQIYSVIYDPMYEEFIATTNIENNMGIPLIKPNFVGDDKYEKYKNNSYEGILITNPFTDIPLTKRGHEMIVHARIKANSLLYDGIKWTDVTFLGMPINNYKVAREQLVKFARENIQVFNNNVFYGSSISVEYNDIKSDVGYYNLIIKIPIVFNDNENLITVTGRFKNSNAPFATDTIANDTALYNYTPFVPVVTVVVGDDGTKTTTTTNPSGTTDIEVIDPSGTITFTPGDIVPYDDQQYNGLIGEIQNGFDRVTDLFVYGLHGLVSIPKILYTTLTSVISGFGDFVPMLTSIFSFLPKQANDLIITAFGFLTLGVALKTLGRK